MLLQIVSLLCLRKSSLVYAMPEPCTTQQCQGDSMLDPSTPCLFKSWLCLRLSSQCLSALCLCATLRNLTVLIRSTSALLRLWLVLCSALPYPCRSLTRHCFSTLFCSTPLHFISAPSLYHSFLVQALQILCNAYQFFTLLCPYLAVASPFDPRPRCSVTRPYSSHRRHCIFSRWSHSLLACG